MKFRILIIFAVLTAGFECSRILILYPTISISHVIPLQSLSVALAKKGHEITFVSPFALSKKIENYRDIVVPFKDADKAFMSEFGKDPSAKTLFKVMPKLLSLIYRIGNETLQMKEMRKLMDEETFDLVIVGYFMTDFMLGVADHFKCPSILFSPATAFTPMLQALGNPLGTSGTPHVMVQVEMNFIGRLKTFLAQGAEFGMVQFHKYRAREIYK